MIESEWQPVRLAPLEQWHIMTEFRRKYAILHIEEIFMVRLIEGFGECGCRKLEVCKSYADKILAERGREPEPVIVCYECEVLSD